MSWLKIINVFLLQWLFVRLTLCKEIKIEDYKLLSYDLMSDGSMSSRGTGAKIEYSWYSIQGFILPLSGWWSDFIYLTKKNKFIRLTEKIKKPII
jgi:hypothetical protein